MPRHTRKLPLTPTTTLALALTITLILTLISTRCASLCFYPRKWLPRARPSTARCTSTSRVGATSMPTLALTLPLTITLIVADPKAWTVTDQFMFGPSYMTAPIYRKGKRSRSVYFPVAKGEGDCEGGCRCQCE